MTEAGDPEHLEVEVYVLIPVNNGEIPNASVAQKRRLPLQMAQIEPTRYRFTYNPTIPEDHYIDIKFCGERIKGLYIISNYASTYICHLHL